MRIMARAHEYSKLHGAPPQHTAGAVGQCSHSQPSLAPPSVNPHAPCACLWCSPSPARSGQPRKAWSGGGCRRATCAPGSDSARLPLRLRTSGSGVWRLLYSHPRRVGGVGGGGITIHVSRCMYPFACLCPFEASGWTARDICAVAVGGARVWVWVGSSGRPGNACTPQPQHAQGAAPPTRCWLVGPPPAGTKRRGCSTRFTCGPHRATSRQNKPMSSSERRLRRGGDGHTQVPALLSPQLVAQ